MSASRTRPFVSILIAALLVVAALGSLSGCKSKDDTEDTKTSEGSSANNGANDAGQQTADGTAGDEGDGSVDEPPVNPPTEITVRLYWVEAGENSLGVERTIPYTQAIATAAMKELLAGPTAAEKATWPAIDTVIPEGTKLLGLTVANGVAKVDLSGEFDDGGGTFSVTARLAQVVYTLTQFPTVNSVEFYMDGVAVEIFSSEGLILGEPQTPEDYYDLLPIDA